MEQVHFKYHRSAGLETMRIAGAGGVGLYDLGLLNSHEKHGFMANVIEAMQATGQLPKPPEPKQFQRRRRRRPQRRGAKKR